MKLSSLRKRPSKKAAVIGGAVLVGLLVAGGAAVAVGGSDTPRETKPSATKTASDEKTAEDPAVTELTSVISQVNEALASVGDQITDPAIKTALEESLATATTLLDSGTPEDMEAHRLTLVDALNAYLNSNAEWAAANGVEPAPVAPATTDGGTTAKPNSNPGTTPAKPSTPTKPAAPAPVPPAPAPQPPAPQPTTPPPAPDYSITVGQAVARAGVANTPGIVPCRMVGGDRTYNWEGLAGRNPGKQFEFRQSGSMVDVYISC